MRIIRARFSMIGGVAGCSPLQIQFVASTVVIPGFEDSQGVPAKSGCLSDVDLYEVGRFLHPRYARDVTGFSLTYVAGGRPDRSERLDAS
jgi:hypothetical protein